MLRTCLLLAVLLLAGCSDYSGQIEAMRERCRLQGERIDTLSQSLSITDKRIDVLTKRVSNLEACVFYLMKREPAGDK